MRWIPLLLLIGGSAQASGYPCLLEPHVVVDISTAVEGVLAQVKVSKGDLVQRGDVVATLQAEVEEALVERAEARVQMQSALRARETDLKRHQVKRRRMVALSEQQFVSPDEIAEQEAALELARIEVERELENQLLYEIDLKRMTAEYNERFIRSPITGVVVERYLNPGEFAQAQPIVRIAQLDPINIEAVLPAEVYGQVKVGDFGDVTIATPVSRTMKAEVTIVEKVIDAASGTFGVRLNLDNPDYTTPAGLECEVEFGFNTVTRF
jgi:RND family efflux transporter MFP subunit